jgi:D-amino-acid dehydrogenase
VLLRSKAEQQLMAPGLAVLHELGAKVQQLDAEQTRAVEPALNADTPLFGSIHLPDDEVGNCRQFAQQLREITRSMGVQWLHRQQVDRIESTASGVRLPCRALEGPNATLDTGPSSGPATWHGDAVVICAGVGSAGLLQPLGINLPMVPVWGYSISAPIKEPLNAPRSAVMDERYKVAISRLGQRVRAAGSAELGGAADAISKPAISTLYKVLGDWFPGAAQIQHVQVWKGGRPMLPEGPPVVGATGVPKVWINTGHGSSGWALSCGSARALADEIKGQKAALEMDGLRLSRYRR